MPNGSNLHKIFEDYTMIKQRHSFQEKNDE